MESLLQEFRGKVEIVMNQHRGQVRDLLRTRLHQDIEDRCTMAQQRLDNVEFPDGVAQQERNALRADRKRLLVSLDKLAASVHTEISQMQKSAGVVSLESRPCHREDDGHAGDRALNDDDTLEPWRDPEVIRRVYERALAEALQHGDESVAQAVRVLLLQVLPPAYE